MPGEVTREHVILAYRMLLGREPESEAVVEGTLRISPSLAALGAIFVSSPEFAGRHGINPHALPPLDAPPQEIETETDPATLRHMIGHLARYWSRMGEEAPHWSVLTEERFLPANIGAHLETFYAGGDWDARLIDAALTRIGRQAGEFAHAVDYGCGVGRITVHLARRFRQVTGLDISPPHLELAAAALRGAGHADVTLRQVTAEDLMPVPACDLWFSRIVLQHDPPPVILHVLGRAFASLAPRGVAIFQLLTWRRGYGFRVADYLAGDPGAKMEIHVVPQRAVLDLACRSGMILRDLREDSFTTGEPGGSISNTFVFEKAGVFEKV